MEHIDINSYSEHFKRAFEHIGLVWESGDYIDDGYTFEERD